MNIYKINIENSSSKMLSGLLVLFVLIFSSSSFGAVKTNDATVTTLEISFISGNELSNINILGFGHEIVLPYDAGSGLPTGKRQHKPFRIVKEFDQVSPLIYNALSNNENIELTIRTFRVGKRNLLTPISSISLQNARVVNIKKPSSENMISGFNGLAEEVSFVYKTITWTDVGSGITSQDSWVGLVE